MTKVDLVKVCRESFDQLFTLILRLAEYERLDPPDEAARQRLVEHLSSSQPKLHAYLGYCDGTPIAYCIYYFTYASFLGKPTLHLEDIFVLPEHRGTGIGRRIMDLLLRISLDEGCGRMEWCVLDWNRGAIAFYRKLGARSLDEWIFFRLSEDRIRSLVHEADAGSDL